MGLAPGPVEMPPPGSDSMTLASSSAGGRSPQGPKHLKTSAPGLDTDPAPVPVPISVANGQRRWPRAVEADGLPAGVHAVPRLALDPHRSQEQSDRPPVTDGHVPSPADPGGILSRGNAKAFQLNVPTVLGFVELQTASSGMLPRAVLISTARDLHSLIS